MAKAPERRLWGNQIEHRRNTRKPAFRAANLATPKSRNPQNVTAKENGRRAMELCDPKGEKRKLDAALKCLFFLWGNEPRQKPRIIRWSSQMAGRDGGGPSLKPPELRIGNKKRLGAGNALLVFQLNPRGQISKARLFQSSQRKL